jgi:hypothetical protein
MKTLRLQTKPLVLSRPEFYRIQLQFILRNVRLTKAEELCVIYYHMYPNPHEKLIEHNVFSNPKSIENYITKLKRLGIIVGKGKETKLNPKISFIDEPFNLTVHVSPEQGSNESQED